MYSISIHLLKMHLLKTKSHRNGCIFTHTIPVVYVEANSPLYDQLSSGNAFSDNRHYNKHDNIRRHNR